MIPQHSTYFQLNKLIINEEHYRRYNQKRIDLGPSNNVKSPPKIFKLNIDCFNEVFDYLSAKDLYSFGQTCKRINKVAGEYFKQNYSSLEKICEIDGIYTKFDDKSTQISGFTQFMPCITLSVGELKKFHYIRSHISDFKSTYHISLQSLRLYSRHIEIIKKLFCQFEVVELRNCRIDANFYEIMLKYCVNLKKIKLSNTGDFYGYYNWLSHEYPKLECFEFIPHPHRVEELNATVFQTQSKYSNIFNKRRFSLGQ